MIRKFCSSMKPLEIFAPLTDEIFAHSISFLYPGANVLGQVVAIGVDGYTPTRSDASRFDRFWRC